MAKKLKRKRKGKVQWSYKKQEEWPGACQEGTFQSPVKFDGSRNEIPESAFTYDMIPNQQTVKTKFEID